MSIHQCASAGLGHTNVGVDAGCGETTITLVLPGLRALSVGTMLLAASASFAPFQCAGEAKPDLRREEEPSEALYNLAEQFKAKGAASARAETLRYLVKMYPTSRFAEAARLDLEGLSEPVPDSQKGGADTKAAAAP